MRNGFARSAAVLVVVGLSFAVLGCSNMISLQGKQKDPQTEIARVFGPAQLKLSLGQGFVVLSPAQQGVRQLGYVSTQGSSYTLVGQRQQVADAGAQAMMKQEADMVVVETQKEGAPQFAAFAVGNSGVTPVDYYLRMAPEPAVKTGHFVLVNKQLNVLWHYLDGKMVKSYRVATGRQTRGPAPTWQDYKTNFFTPEGIFKVTNFVTNPTYNALKPGDQSYAGGAAGNPLGTRWMGFTVLNNDNAWVWGIHGTSHPELIGTWASDGCIRMFTQEVEELFTALKGKNPSLQVVGH